MKTTDNVKAVHVRDEARCPRTQKFTINVMHGVTSSANKHGWSTPSYVEIDGICLVSFICPSKKKKKKI